MRVKRFQPPLVLSRALLAKLFPFIFVDLFCFHGLFSRSFHLVMGGCLGYSLDSGSADSFPFSAQLLQLKLLMDHCGTLRPGNGF